MSNVKSPMSNRRKKPRSVGTGYAVDSKVTRGRRSRANSVAKKAQKARLMSLRPLLGADGAVIKEKLKSSSVWLNFSPMVRGYWNRIEHRQSKLMWAAVVLAAPLIFFSTVAITSSDDSKLVVPQTNQESCIWQICAIDTMKTSRDMARTYLNDPSYDEDITLQLRAIKGTGADYVSITTPYDEEFRPYLKRWVKLARQEGLKVWFRGNWSSWEGWFGYPKNMSPEDHLAKNSQFIADNDELFQNGDIFDPCPECENAGFWPQNDKNQDYRAFVLKQQKQTEEDFGKINKTVMVHQSMIGGRAKDVLDKETFDKLGNVIAIDHYVPKTAGMEEYIDYFDSLGTKSLVSEFGAPIPDMNGNMNQKQQAEFVESILEVLYQKRSAVEGLNYWVLSTGTTSLVDDSYQPRDAYAVVKKYFSPARVEGRVTNSLGEGVKDVMLRTADNATTVKTDDDGYYHFSIPPRQFELFLDDPEYTSQSVSLEAEESGQVITHDFQAEPENPGIIYNIRRFWKNFVHDD